MRLRWELSKIWGRPLHDSVFDEIPPLHWPIYTRLISSDREEDADVWRSRIEYLARFTDNEAVNEIQRRREAVKGGDEDSFDILLKHRFGRGIGSQVQREVSVKELGQQINQANRS